MFDSNMYIATTSTLTWCIVVELFFSLQLPSFGSSPKTIECFMHASGYYKHVFLRIYDGFAVPLQLVFLPFLTKFLMKGLVRWVFPLLLLYGVFPFGYMLIPRGRCIYDDGPWKSHSHVTAVKI